MSYSIKIASLEEAYRIYRNIPEFCTYDSMDYIEKRIHQNPLILLCMIENKPAGFKIGYERSSKEFYSWLGGVLPQFRRGGVAELLLKTQEKEAVLRGYNVIRVKSMNRFPAMMAMLLKNGYFIEGTTTALDCTMTKIHFCKVLTKDVL